jgi:hypothetical protein
MDACRVAGLSTVALQSLWRESVETMAQGPLCERPVDIGIWVTADHPLGHGGGLRQKGPVIGGHSEIGGPTGPEISRRDNHR